MISLIRLKIAGTIILLLSISLLGQTEISDDSLFQMSIEEFTTPYSNVYNAIFILEDSRVIETEDELRGKKTVEIFGEKLV